jgi:hypothetical protein
VRHSKQIHIFATRSDLEQGLRVFEAEVGVKYVRCDLYYGPTFEQYFSLLDWEGLGSNNTGDHITGPCFLALKRDVQVNAEAVPQNATPSATVGKVRYDVNQQTPIPCHFCLEASSMTKGSLFVGTLEQLRDHQFHSVCIRRS